MFTSKKYQKPIKTKFRENRDEEHKSKQKKHHDKNTWRMLRQEKEDYVL
jgi:hypothetical protein